MEYDEDELLKPMTLKEKIKEKLPDAFYFGLMVFAFAFAAYGNKNIKPNMNQSEQIVNKVQTVKQANTVMYNDSIKQNIR